MWPYIATNDGKCPFDDDVPNTRPVTSNYDSPLLTDDHRPVGAPTFPSTLAVLQLACR